MTEPHAPTLRAVAQAYRQYKAEDYGLDFVGYLEHAADLAETVTTLPRTAEARAVLAALTDTGAV